jgi:hypothetical protein
MKVKIQNRSVYHKFAEVEIEVPDDVKDIQEWLFENEQTYIYEMDRSINESKYEFGFGVGSDANLHYNSCMNEPESESEWRYETEKEGGHL